MFTSETNFPPGCQHLYAIQHKGDILPIRTYGDFFPCRLCIDTAMSNRHVVSFREYSNNRYFQQSITALILITFRYENQLLSLSYIINAAVSARLDL